MAYAEDVKPLRNNDRQGSGLADLTPGTYTMREDGSLLDSNGQTIRRSGGLINRATAPPPKPSGYQEDGSYHLNTNVTDDEAEKMAGRVSREQFERYMQRFAPQEQAMLSTIDDTQATNAASSSNADAQRSRAALERMRERYGTSLTSGQQKAETSQNQRSTALGSLSATNTGRQLDEDRRFNLYGTMLNIGNNLSSSATGGLTESANNAAARERAYDQAKAQHKTHQYGLIGDLLGSI